MTYEQNEKSPVLDEINITLDEPVSFSRSEYNDFKIMLNIFVNAYLASVGKSNIFGSDES